MSLPCKQCGADLDGGEIFTMLKQQEPNTDPVLLIQYAYKLGWTTQNHRRFNKALIRKQGDKNAVTVCPVCKVINPVSDDSIPIMME